MPAKKRKATHKKVVTVSHARYKKVVAEKTQLKKQLKKVKADLVKAVKKAKCSKEPCKKCCKAPAKRKTVKKHVAMKKTHTKRQAQPKKA